jgi:hypothetical protein
MIQSRDGCRADKEGPTMMQRFVASMKRGTPIMLMCEVDDSGRERDHERAEFGAFLRMLRLRIPSEAASIGNWRRLPILQGRPVTQAEIAEVVSVSRNWYRRLERGESVRASVPLLDRLANAFALRPEERTKLFVLAIPEMGQGPSRATRDANF